MRAERRGLGPPIHEVGPLLCERNDPTGANKRERECCDPEKEVEWFQKRTLLHDGGRENLKWTKVPNGPLDPLKARGEGPRELTPETPPRKVRWFRSRGNAVSSDL